MFDIKIGWRDYFVDDGCYDSVKGYELLAGRIFNNLGAVSVVPIVQSVVHDHQSLISGMARHPYSGTETGYYRKNHFEYGTANEFINGNMICFAQDTTFMADTSIWTDDQDSAYVYLRNLVKMRKGIKDYLVYGEWRRPPRLLWADSTDVNLYDKKTFTTPSILASAFVKVDSLGAEEDSLCLFFTNFSDSAASCTTSVYLPDYGMTVGDSSRDFQICEFLFDVVRDTTDNCTITTVSSDSLKKYISLDNENSVAYEFIMLP